MSNARQDNTAGPGAAGGDWWSRRPRRSANDRKIAGVAGGLGRAFGVDPVLIRVAFVILTIFGGVGGLLYVLGWLLLPSDGDEVSAAESLLGRGRSSTPPVVAVGLAIIAAISVASMLSWGLPFWPLIVIGVVAVVIARKRGVACARNGEQWNSTDWSTRVSQQAQSWGEQAEQWVARQPWSGMGNDERAKDPTSSPFGRPPFWDESSGSQTQAQRQDANGPVDPSGDPSNNPSTAGGSRVNLSKHGPSGAGDRPAGQPPAWDPLGVAPFAWDLPEPAPVPQPPPAPRPRSVVGRVTMGLVLLAGGLATAGIFLGWWQLTWAGVAATALAVVAVGLLIGSLRGRGQWLIGPGIFLSLVTLALTMTGINGTDDFGQQTWTPATPTALNSQYVVNGGQGELDLRKLSVPAGQTVDTTLEVRAGQASVIVPSDANLNVTCSTNVGEVDCLGTVESGLHKQATTTQHGSSDEGTINLNVRVGAGQAEVRHG